MQRLKSADGWRWEMYRHVALFVHYPTEANQEKLTVLINEFRRQSEERDVPRVSDEHEYVMDYR